MNSRKVLNHKVGDIHVWQQESIIYIPLKKHLTIHSSWEYRQVLKALNYIIGRSSLEPLRQREQNYLGVSHPQKLSELSAGGASSHAREMNHNLLLISSLLPRLWLSREKLFVKLIWNLIQTKTVLTLHLFGIKKG